MDKLANERNLELFWNVQFIYELGLAMMELESFGVKYSTQNSLRTFTALEIPDEEKFNRRTAYFQKIDNQITLYSKLVSNNITRSINQYLTHWIYPYKGKFHPQMIRGLLNCMQINPGDKILDPFIGSGTTAVEAQLLGIDCVGIDISEVCYLVSNVKTNSHKYVSQLEMELEDFIQYLLEYKNENVEENISEKISKIEKSEIRNFFRVAELIAHSDKGRRRKKDFSKSFLVNANKMFTSVTDYENCIIENNLTLGEVSINKNDVRELEFPAKHFDGIITSPPYSIALDYVDNDKHALKSLGHNLDNIKDDFIGVRGKGSKKIELYNEDMKNAYQEMDRVLKSGKYCTIIIGNARVDKEEIKTVENTIKIFQEMNYKLVKNIDKIIFGLYNIMQKENILIFKKE
ncbi:MAG: DNA methyltransferase [Candidatus Heimdallarchaeaceae archaeon]